MREARFNTKRIVLAIATALLLGSSLLAQKTQDNSAEVVYEMGNGVTPPKGVYTPIPDYPDRARKRNISGQVRIRMIVTPQGTVRNAQVTKSLDKDLDKQALAAVNTWKFEPGSKDGKPVAVYLSAAVTFRR